MKVCTNKFKENVSEFGRELDNKITYYSNNELVTLGNESLTSVTPHYEGDILKSVMKQLDVESSKKIPIGTEINYKFGVKVLDTKNEFNYDEYTTGENSNYKVEKNNDEIKVTTKKGIDTTNINNKFYTELKLNKGKYNINFNIIDTNANNIKLSIDKIQYSQVGNIFQNVAICNNNDILEINSNDTYYARLIVTNDTYPCYAIVNNIIVEQEAFEYIDFGNYSVYKVERQEDTNNYAITCYDKMLNSMTDYKGVNVTYPCTIKQYITQLCNDINVEFKNANEEFVNYDKQILRDYYKDLTYTNRDVLDQLAQATASTICISNDNKLEIRYINETNEEIDATKLNEVNVNFGERFGPVNSIVLSRAEETDDLYRKNQDSINENGLYELKIKDNLIMSQENREDFIAGLYNTLNNLYYYIVDYESVGFGYLDLCDSYYVTSEVPLLPSDELYPNNDLYPRGSRYKTIMLNDEFISSENLTENVYSNEPEKSETDYKSATQTDKDERQADLMIERKLAKVTIKADQIDLEGSNINLTSNNMTISSTNFNVDKNGNVNAQNGTFSGTVNANSGKIGPWIMNSDAIYNSKVIGIDGSCGLGNIKDWAFWAGNGNFRVSETGYIYCNNADITGNINANSGTFKGNVDITTQGQTARFTIRDQENTNCYYTQSARKIEWIGNGGGNLTMWNTVTTPTIGLTGTDGSKTEISAYQVKSPQITPTSLEETKKNFKKFNNGLNVLKDIDIYEYNLKFENDKDKKHIGLVIGDKYNYSKVITSKENDSVDLYSFVSVCCKAIKEQQEQIEELKKEIKNLKDGE